MHLEDQVYDVHVCIPIPLVRTGRPGRPPFLISKAYPSYITLPNPDSKHACLWLTALVKVNLFTGSIVRRAQCTGITGVTSVDDNSEDFLTVRSRFEASGKEAVDDKCEEAAVALESLVAIVRCKLKLGRACSRALLLLKAFDGCSKGGPESAM